MELRKKNTNLLFIHDRFMQWVLLHEYYCIYKIMTFSFQNLYQRIWDILNRYIFVIVVTYFIIQYFFLKYFIYKMKRLNKQVRQLKKKIKNIESK